MWWHVTYQCVGYNILFACVASLLTIWLSGSLDEHFVFYLSHARRNLQTKLLYNWDVTIKSCVGNGWRRQQWRTDSCASCSLLETLRWFLSQMYWWLWTRNCWRPATNAIVPWIGPYASIDWETNGLFSTPVLIPKCGCSLAPLPSNLRSNLLRISRPFCYFDWGLVGSCKLLRCQLSNKKKCQKLLSHAVPPSSARRKANNSVVD